MRDAELAELPETLRDLHAMWNAKRGARAFPARAEFAVDDVKPWLGRLHLVEILDGDFRFAVFGTIIADLLQREYNGLRLSEIADPIARTWEAGYRAAADRRAPVFGFHEPNLYSEREIHVSWWRAILPVGQAGRLTHLLVGIQVVDAKGRYL
ncbi:MAG: PAS domain-containing protein [Tagaea sp.]|nr:PAS domain-containing protein [Tagaea sp.]